VQITLSWTGAADLDLWVIEPSGTRIYYGDPASPSGGQLDVDNRCDNFRVGRPENIFWPRGKAPARPP